MTDVSTVEELARDMPPIRPNPSESEQVARVVSRLRKIDNAGMEDIQIVRVPLRICPLGAHIDHQLGIVTGMTIDQSILMAFAPSGDGSVRIESLNFEKEAGFDVGNVPPFQSGDWANYARGAVLALQQSERVERGLIGVIGGSMPIGGLSSSAAVTIAYLLALQSLNAISVGPEENVELCRYTENQYVGLNNGILDQSVILYSEEDNLTRIDCQNVEIDKIPYACPPAEREEYDILVVYSGVTRVLVGTDYNNRVVECQEAARALLGFSGQVAGADARLRDVPPVVFAEEGHRLATRPYRRARHYFGEMERVEAGATAWQAGDLTRFGALVTASGASSVEWYECGSPQLITLYEILRETSGVYGTRFSGAGFRGNCIALIDPLRRGEIAEAIHSRYPCEHPAEAETYSIHFCQPDGGARLLGSASEYQPFAAPRGSRQANYQERAIGRCANMQGVILAAGKGSRLHPLTLQRSKAMIPILGKPIVERVLETFAENGIDHVIMVVSKEDGEIQRYFREESKLAIDVQFVTQTERLGMANALSLAAPFLHDTFAMSACDNLTPLEHVAKLVDTHKRREAEATLSLMEIERSLVSKTGIVEWQDETVRRIVEKPSPEEAPSNISSLPLYIFSLGILDFLPQIRLSSRGEYELQDAIQMLIEERGGVTGVFTEERLQLTNAGDLLALNRHYLNEGGDTPQLAPQSVGKHTHLITPLRIEEGTVIGSGCVIGPRVYIERDCRIGAHVLIKDAVLLRGSVIDDGQQIVGEVVS